VQTVLDEREVVAPDVGEVDVDLGKLRQQQEEVREARANPAKLRRGTQPGEAGVGQPAELLAGELAGLFAVERADGILANTGRNCAASS
jgi:hypothetical protein